MDLREIGCDGRLMDWIHLAQDRGLLWALLKTVMKLWVL
jgi:hypothetical protein